MRTDVSKMISEIEYKIDLIKEAIATAKNRKEADGIFSQLQDAQYLEENEIWDSATQVVEWEDE